jgi:hypothetical protein
MQQHNDQVKFSTRLAGQTAGSDYRHLGENSGRIILEVSQDSRVSLPSQRILLVTIGYKRYVLIRGNF